MSLRCLSLNHWVYLLAALICTQVFGQAQGSAGPWPFPQIQGPVKWPPQYRFPQSPAPSPIVKSSKAPAGFLNFPFGSKLDQVKAELAARNIRFDSLNINNRDNAALLLAYPVPIAGTTASAGWLCFSENAELYAGYVLFYGLNSSDEAVLFRRLEDTIKFNYVISPAETQKKSTTKGEHTWSDRWFYSKDGIAVEISLILDNWGVGLKYEALNLRPSESKPIPAGAGL